MTANEPPLLHPYYDIYEEEDQIPPDDPDYFHPHRQSYTLNALLSPDIFPCAYEEDDRDIDAILLDEEEATTV